jgi:hypothetical protein
VSVLGYRCWYVDQGGFLNPVTDSGLQTAWSISAVEAGMHYPNLSSSQAPPRMAVWQQVVGTFSPSYRPIEPHQAPQLGCTCGLYAFNSPEHMLADMPGAMLRSARTPTTEREYLIGGVVALSGHAIVHRKGYRSARAHIRAIYDPTHRVGGIYDDVARYTDLDLMFSEWYVEGSDALSAAGEGVGMGDPDPA